MANNKKSEGSFLRSIKLSTEEISVILGLFMTLIFAIVYLNYSDYTRQFEAFRKPNAFYGFLQDLSHRYNDIKYRIRGPHPTEAPVALVAIDDDSLKEVGRWPWSRDLIAQLVENALANGAKAIGFDVMFSEAEKGAPQNDQKFGATVEKNAAQVVLGTSSENQYPFLVYQDYCVTEAFLATRGDQIVKLNPSLIVDDVSGVFDNLNWSKLFTPLFHNQKQITEIEVLKSLHKKSVDELTPFQKNYLASKQSQGLFEYCKTWGTKEDFFLSAEMKSQVAPLYEEIFKEEPALKDLTWEQAFIKLKTETPLHPVTQYGEWTPNIPEIQNTATYTASFIAQQDPDGPVRRYPLFFRSGNRIGTSFIPSLALQTYLVATGYRADVKIDKPQANAKRKEIIHFKIMDPSEEPEKLIVELPVDTKGQLLVNYYGGQNTLPYISARELLNDSDRITVMQQVQGANTSQILIKSEEKSKKEFLNGRALLVGASALALYDLRTTPLQANYPGPEIHLTTLANLFDKNFLQYHEHEKYIILAALIILGVLTSVIWSYSSALISVLFFVLSLGATLAIDYYVFNSLNLVTSGVFAVLLIIANNYISMTAIRFFLEEKKKKEIKSTFSKYVSPKVVDELLSSEENLKLGGRKQVMTVFFSDVRGFTTISEKLSPEELSNVLNRYLTPMTELVFKNNGTLDKYMGDAIMAFFGAPIQTPLHPKQACQCALDNLVKLKEIQDEFEKEGLPFIDVGIGINTGEMSVGNMGSNIVQNYTVMGDSVNLASRLEGINKTYGTKIIISEFTQKEVANDFVTREVDRVQVKGKNEPVRIFELIQAGSRTSDLSWVEEFEKGYGLYLGKNFESAISTFESVIKMRQKDPVSDLYIERCRDFIAEPPPSDWDGVYVSKTK